MLSNYFLSCCKWQDKLLASRTAAEVAIGKTINNDVIPVVEKFQKVSLTGPLSSTKSWCISLFLCFCFICVGKPVQFIVLYRRKKGH